MKNYLWILVLVLIALNSCAKPEVVDVVMPEDEKLNCKQLEDGIVETRIFKKKAEAIKDVSSGGNMTRAMLFWPALLKTINNADVAMRAADHRAFHLVKIMRKKNCQDADKIFNELTKKTNPVYVSLELDRLFKLYKRGALTEEEFKQAKKKVLILNEQTAE